MRTLILITLLITSSYSFGQAKIDLKKLIGMQQKVALNSLKSSGIELLESSEYESVWMAYDEGIQIKIENGKVTTIWIEFTDRRTGAFPHPIDNVVTPNVDINKVIAVYGEPDKIGGGMNLGSVTLGGWVRWDTAAYQLHCEVKDSKVVMVTIMESDWEPGK